MDETAGQPVTKATYVEKVVAEAGNAIGSWIGRRQEARVMMKENRGCHKSLQIR